MEGNHSAHSSGHSLRGLVNAGGVPLAIHTSNGDVTISALQKEKENRRRRWHPPESFSDAAGGAQLSG